MVELADTPALGAGGRKAMGVQIPLPAPDKPINYLIKNPDKSGFLILSMLKYF